MEAKDLVVVLKYIRINIKFIQWIELKSTLFESTNKLIVKYILNSNKYKICILMISKMKFFFLESTPN